MAQIEFVVPEAVTNYFTNPRFGDGATTGLTLVGSAISSILTRARWGVYSVQVVTNGAAVNEGCYATVTFGAPGTSGNWAGSVYLRGAGTVRIRLRDNTNGVEVVSDEVALTDDRWTRVEVNGSFPAGVLDMRLYIETTIPQAVTFYVDGIQVESNSYVTTYTDGDRELELPPHDGFVYYKWNGVIHASTSNRSAECRTGGKTEVIENVDANLYITDMQGLGMPPIDLHLSQYATMDRARVEGWKTMPRVVNLHFFAKRLENTDVLCPASLNELHQQRQRLENIVKPDKSPNSQPLIMRYTDGFDARKVELFVHYEGGLEWSGDIRAPFLNDFVVRFLAADPYFYEDTQDVESLTGVVTLTDADYIIARVDGEWTEVGDADGNVYKIAVHPITGDIYAGGAFTTIDGVTANTNFIARWDGEAWNDLAGGGLNGEVRAIAFLADGNVLIGGGFTNIGVPAFNRMAEYDPVGDVYSTVGAQNGFDNKVYDFAVRDDGKVYTVGLFTNDSAAVVTYNFVALFDPVANTFATIGAGPGFDDSAFCASMDNDGSIVYIGGVFTTTNGGAANLLDSLTFYDPGDDSFNAMGTGLEAADDVIDILCTHDNRVYAVGEFTHIGFVDVGYVGVWNGMEWYPLGVEDDGFVLDGAGTSVRALHENYKNLLFIGGDIDGATGAPLYRGFGSWNRSRFQQWDLLMPTNHVYTIATRADDIWLGFNNNGSTLASEVFTIDNVGRTTTYPILEILGPCYLEWLENQTTGEIVRLDLDILAGERAVIDFRPWNRFVRSTLRSNVIKSILADSDELHILPGDNVMAIFCEDTSQDTEISLRWPIIHWGFDDLR